MNQSARQTLLLIHGRGTQPADERLLADWTHALSHALARDHDKTLDGVNVKFIHYGDVTRRLDPDREKYDPVLDQADRQNALRALTSLRSKEFRRSGYESVPGQSPLKEFLADLGVPITRALGLSNRRLAHFYPELHAYWQDEELSVELRNRLVEPLGEALRRSDHIMVISHCVGTVLAYDAFWDASQQVSSNEQRVHSWLTMGTPLADNDVRKRLGGQPSGFPNLLINWFNLAAEDDPVCHDETVADDFKSMLSERHISRIQDYHIYNLTERYGRSDPHDALGYLIHPRTSGLVSDWLNATPGI